MRAPGRARGYVTNTPAVLLPGARRAAATAVIVVTAAGAAIAEGPPPLPTTPAASIGWLTAPGRAQSFALAGRADVVFVPGPAAVHVAAAARPVPSHGSRDHTRPAAPRSPAKVPAPRRAGQVGGFTPPAPLGGAAVVVGFVLGQVGHPYLFGQAGPRGFDCSGLAMAAYARAGIRLPHDADAIRNYGRPVSRAQLAPGDLVLYPGHVGVYVGGGQMVAAANPREGVVRQPIYGTPTGYRRLL